MPYYHLAPGPFLEPPLLHPEQLLEHALLQAEEHPPQEPHPPPQEPHPEHPPSHRPEHPPAQEPEHPLHPPAHPE
jgi:hypothetical protein CRE_25073